MTVAIDGKIHYPDSHLKFHFAAAAVVGVSLNGVRARGKKMVPLVLGVIAQLCLAQGMIGLLWPEKLKDCTVLWFPFFPTHRTIRSIGVLSLCAAVALFGLLLMQPQLS